jgi:hypothetical protein
VEKKTEHLADNKTVENEYLNLLTENGLKSLPMNHQALQVLSTGHDTQKKTVAISFDGEGKRRVSVAYIAQTPVWKTSYRLVLDEKEKPY